MKETIFFIIFLLLFLILEYFWIRQLIHAIRHKKFKWIIAIFLLNFIGASFYWRIKKVSKIDQEDFHKIINAWLEHNGYSLEKSREILSKIGEFAAKYLTPYIVPMLILNFIGEYSEIPTYIALPIYIIILGALLFPIKKITQVWRRDDIVVPFLSTMIFWALSGKDHLPTNKSGVVVDETTIQSKPDTLRGQIIALMMADVFFLSSFNMLIYLIYTAISPNEDISELGGIGVVISGTLVFLLILFIGIMFNIRILLYNRPDYLLYMIKNYTRYKWILYVFINLFFIGIFVGLLLIPFTFEN